jgi:acylphosphatase
VSDRIGRRVTVSGRVQGVNFRASTEQAARRAGVDGWVSNADDGSVRAHLEGPADAVEQVIAFMRTGPAHAAVTDVAVDEAPPEGARRFQIR